MTSDLTTKAAEIRARLEGVQRQYACPYATISQDLLSQTLALIEQQAAELAEARGEHRNIQTALAEETARTIAAVRERDEARASEDSLTKRRDYYRERMAAAGGELNRISAAIGSVRFMDPPDGGDVSLAEQVKRMREALTTAESERAELLREKERLGAIADNARLAIVLSLSFLSRDLGTDRLRGTVSDVIRKLSDADTEIRRARSALAPLGEE